MLKVHNCQFVNFSDLMEGLNCLIEVFNGSSHDFSFGDNDISLITIKEFFGEIDDIKGHGYGCDQIFMQEIQILDERIKSLPGQYDCYVNLEA